MFRINLPRVKERDPDLYYKLMDTFLVRETDGDELTLPDAKLNWLQPRVRQQVLLLEREFRADAAAEQQRKADAEAAEKQQKVAADAEAYKNRLLQYIREQGLEPSAGNAETIRQWLNKTANGYMSAGNADAAISVLRSRLTWKSKEQPAPAPAAPEPEPVVILSDGSDQLPLGTQPSHSHTKAQLLDLDKRERAGKKQDRKGWHSLSI